MMSSVIVIVLSLVIVCVTCYVIICRVRKRRRRLMEMDDAEILKRYEREERRPWR